MQPQNIERTLAAVADDDRVLDVGGWAAPLNRADWVLDLEPYETRGVLPVGSLGPGPERFSAGTWVVRDICDHEPWPFEDDFFDFAVCAQTLEDIRDPIWVCREMSRVAKAGMVEVPSLLEELTWEAPDASGGPWAGHQHHRWICTEENGTLVFLLKFHSLHARRDVQVRRDQARRLAPEERTLTIFWEGELPAHERVAYDYPYDELRAAIATRFPPSRRDRLERRGRELAGRIRRRLGFTRG